MVAYLDAGTGSMVIGVVAAGVAGAGVAMRSTIGRFRRKGKSEQETAAADATNAEPADSSDAGDRV